jgi:transcriptional regulator of acetoin/glycerol metabolism
MTAALPIMNERGSLYAVIDIDFVFEELTKLVV